MTSPRALASSPTHVGRCRATISSKQLEVTLMSAIDRQGSQGSGPVGNDAVDLKLEVVVIPVADADRSKAFYAGLGLDA